MRAKKALEEQNKQRLKLMTQIQTTTQRPDDPALAGSEFANADLWYVAKLDSFATQTREFQALSGVGSMAPLNKYIFSYNAHYELALAAAGKKKRKKLEKQGKWQHGGDSAGEEAIMTQFLQISPALEMALEKKYNESQLNAIHKARKTEGITLVQGPPGTGKSTTIIGIISVLLNSMVVRKRGVDYSQMAAVVDGKRVPLWQRKVASDDCHKVDKMENNKASESEWKTTRSLTTTRTDLSDAEKAALREKQKMQNLRVLREAMPWTMSDAQVATRNAEIIRRHNEVSALHDEKTNIISQRNSRYVPKLLYTDSWYDREANDVNGGLLLTNFAKIGSDDIRSMADVSETQDTKFCKVLVCAPSNAAIDEILRRLTSDGIWGADGHKYKPMVVRMGPGVHPDLRKYSLEYMAMRRAMKDGKSNSKQELDPIKRLLLKEANIVCATCSVAGSRDFVQFGYDFESVVIDEASQGVEPSTLVPLQLGCKRLVLVGDPRQLPATVFSYVASQFNYERSLFQRLEADGFPVEQLDTQYRMHPEVGTL